MACEVAQLASRWQQHLVCFLPAWLGLEEPRSHLRSCWAESHAWVRVATSKEQGVNQLPRKRTPEGGAGVQAGQARERGMVQGLGRGRGWQGDEEGEEEDEPGRVHKGRS